MTTLEETPMETTSIPVNLNYQSIQATETKCQICKFNDFESTSRRTYIKALESDDALQGKPCQCEMINVHPHCVKSWTHLTRVCPNCYGPIEDDLGYKAEQENENSKAKIVFCCGCSAFMSFLVLCITIVVLSMI